MRGSPVKRDHKMAESVPLAPRSPCIEVCALDENDVCIGCHRTAGEIVEWFSATDDRKREILESIRDRRRPT
jgi:predicted Fe-S protein YdhL (DUF1289 family)